MEINQQFDAEARYGLIRRQSIPQTMKQLKFEWYEEPELIVENQKYKIKNHETVSKSKSK